MKQEDDIDSMMSERIMEMEVEDLKVAKKNAIQKKDVNA
jgi:hypothetical protein